MCTSSKRRGIREFISSKRATRSNRADRARIPDNRARLPRVFPGDLRTRGAIRAIRIDFVFLTGRRWRQEGCFGNSSLRSLCPLSKEIRRGFANFTPKLRREDAYRSSDLRYNWICHSEKEVTPIEGRSIG